MQWIFVLCGCMFLLSLIAPYQVCTVSLKAGLYTYNPVERTAHSAGFWGIPGVFCCGPSLTGSVRPGGHQANAQNKETHPQDREFQDKAEGH
jgi:hypothetical protein